MSETNFFIKKADLSAFGDVKPFVREGEKSFLEEEGYTFAGFILAPNIDGGGLPAMYLNSIYTHPDPERDDIIVQNKKAKGCPYPPGYPRASESGLP